MSLFPLLFTLVLSGASLVASAPLFTNGTLVSTPSSTLQVATQQSSCFPALGFKMPEDVPSSLDGWWCDPGTEYAFMGFSYEVEECQDRATLTKHFKDARKTYNSRYVRLYGACDKKNYYDDVVEAAWEAGIGVHALVWFGFDGDDKWKTRRDTLFASIKSNPKAPFVTRVVQFGSEPLFDGVLSPEKLTAQVQAAKTSLKNVSVPVTVSEMRYGYQENGGAQDVLDAIDSINIHMLPFFAGNAGKAKDAWSIVNGDIEWFTTVGKGKKMYLDENGWPSVTSEGVQPNSPNAVADVQNEHDYYDLLDKHCKDFKDAAGGGVGWFAHIYTDAQEPGYGILDGSMKPKFTFKPKTSC